MHSMARKVFNMGLVLFLMAMMWTDTLAQPNCMPTIVSLSPCLGFITGNSSTPSSSCCTQLASVVQTQAQCLCTVLNGGPQLPLVINQTQALTLPGACKIQTPPPSQCKGKYILRKALYHSQSGYKDQAWFANAKYYLLLCSSKHCSTPGSPSTSLINHTISSSCPFRITLCSNSHYPISPLNSISPKSSCRCEWYSTLCFSLTTILQWPGPAFVQVQVVLIVRLSTTNAGSKTVPTTGQTSSAGSTMFASSILFLVFLASASFTI